MAAAAARRIALGSTGLSSGIARAYAQSSPALSAYRALGQASHAPTVGLSRARLGGAFAVKRWKSSDLGSTKDDQPIDLRPPRDNDEIDLKSPKGNDEIDLRSPKNEDTIDLRPPDDDDNADPMAGKRFLDGPRDGGPLDSVRDWKWTDVSHEVLKFSEGKSRVVLIDTRELHELKETGWIPGAIHIPIVSAVQSFHISDSDFMDMMGYKRPSKDTPIVLYCKAGVRAVNAAGLAVSAGYTQVGVYRGSFSDWINHELPVSHDTSHYHAAPEQPKAIELDVLGSEGPKPSQTATELEEVDYETYIKPKRAHGENIIAPMGEAYGKDARRRSKAYLGDRVSNESDGRRMHRPPARRGMNSGAKFRRPY